MSDKTDGSPEPTEPEPAPPPESEEAPDRTDAPEATQAPTAVAVSPPPPPTRRLVRRPEGKVIAGVCTGLAAYMGIDVVVVRIAVVLLAVFSGVGLVGYVVAWLVMPMAPEGEPVPPVPGGSGFAGANAGRWIGIGAIVLGAFILFHNVWDFRGGIFWGLLLVGIGIALWGREFGNRPTNGEGRPGAPEPSPTSEVTNTGSITTPLPPAPPNPPVPPAPPTARAAASPAPAPSPSRREPSVLGRLVVGAAALAVGIGVLLDNLDVINTTAKGMFAVLLAIVGAGLIAGAWWGRARWLIFPGIVLVIALAIASFLPTDIRGDFGEVVWQPRSRAELKPLYEHGAGEAVLDFSQVAWGTKDKNIEVHHGFGELLVVVPDDVPVDVTAHVQGGEMTLFGRNRSGWDVDLDVKEGGDSELGTLNLDVEMNFGEITVRRSRTSDDFSAGDSRGTKVEFDFRGGPRVNVDTNPGDER